MWLVHSFRVLHPAGTKSNRSPEGSSCDATSHENHQQHICLFSTQLIDQETSSCCLTNVWTFHGRRPSSSQSEASVSCVWRWEQQTDSTCYNLLTSVYETTGNRCSFIPSVLLSSGNFLTQFDDFLSERMLLCFTCSNMFDFTLNNNVTIS